MTERKPAGVSFEGWVERQVREARERGAFDALPGAGRPLPATSGDGLDWVREKMRREDLPVTAVLPPSLALAKQVEDLPVRLAREPTEARVRATLADLNARIEQARRGPQVGPPMRTRPVDVEAAVQEWQQQRARPCGPAGAGHHAVMTEPADARSALDLRTTLALFGLVTCAALAVLAVLADLPAAGAVLAVLAVVAVVDLAVLRRRLTRAAGASGSLFE